MRGNILNIGLALLFFSCNQKVIEPPKNLIPEGKMVEMLTELATINAAKINNVSVLQNHNIEPMPYILRKFGYDSIQFVESDRYYASIPVKYEAIYLIVQSKLEKQGETEHQAKLINDSLKLIETEAKRMGKITAKRKDSLL